MSTNATISKQNTDGSVETIYLHWDGYINGAGLTLKTAYNTEEAIDELLSYGDASVLEETIASCVFYGRDRGERGTEARKHSSVEAFRLNEKMEYNYLFVDGVWKVGEMCEGRLTEFVEF